MADKFVPPQTTSGDTAHLVAQGLLSFIPGASQLFQRLVTPPLEKRREQWMRQVAQALQELEAARVVTLDDLRNNEAFITILVQASQAAVRNHQEEKIRALSAAVINTVTHPDLQQDLRQRFIGFIDELSPSHMTLLGFLARNDDAARSASSYEALYQMYVAFVNSPLTRDEFMLLCSDLTSRALIRFSPDLETFGDVFESDALTTEGPKHSGPMYRVTEVGKAFLDFISPASYYPAAG